MPATFVALLRAVNLGARNKVPMKELREALESLGLEDVVTYVQSGNVVFRSKSGKAADLAAAIEEAVADRFGVATRVLIRTAAQLRSVAESNPFLGSADTSHLYVVFLERRPAADAVRRLDPARSPGESFAVQGAHVYLHLPGGFGPSKLSNAYFERGLALAATTRNWKTVTTLVELARR